MSKSPPFVGELYILNSLWTIPSIMLLFILHSVVRQTQKCRRPEMKINWHQPKINNRYDPNVTFPSILNGGKLLENDVIFTYESEFWYLMGGNVTMLSTTCTFIYDCCVKYYISYGEMDADKCNRHQLTCVGHAS